MIIGYDFIGLSDKDSNGAFWDTAVATDMLDELQFNEGTYDEAFIILDTDVGDDTVQPSIWTNTTIMDAKFEGNLDGGSIGVDGFNVTQIQLYRSIYGSYKWDAIGQFEYNPDFNIYDYVDRYVQNGATYQYGIVPKANEILGDMSKSEPIDARFEGIYITDRKENRKLEYDIELGDMMHNTNNAINQPLNSQYPVATFGNSNYRTGNLSVLPLSRQTIALAGDGIDKLAEQINRQEWLDFLNNGKAKVLRMDSGVLMLIATHNTNMSYKYGDALRDLANISFDYTEIGELNFITMSKSDLIPKAYSQHMTYDDYGNPIN